MFSWLLDRVALHGDGFADRCDVEEVIETVGIVVVGLAPVHILA